MFLLGYFDVVIEIIVIPKVHNLHICTHHAQAPTPAVFHVCLQCFYIFNISL